MYLISYSVAMYEVAQTKEFRRWHRELRDSRAIARITSAIERLQRGLLGDYKSVGQGISEIRIPYGPGYRLYYTTRERRLIVLLCGGDKTTQKRDIKRAQKLKEDYDV
jgi:putative addiction module killer protein